MASTELRAAAQQALEALEVATNCLDGYYIPRGKTTLPEIEDAITALKAAQAEPVQEPVACLIGTKGSAFDSPTTKRAYTYAEQPGNVVASRLGLACNAAASQSAGDSIDRGLGLLQELQRQGFGVFDLGAEYAAPPQRPAEPVQEPVAWLRVIDEAMVTHHLGVADPADDYETAKRKMNTLLCMAQDIGTYFAKQAEPVQEPKPVAYIDALKDAFFEGFTSVATYNDMLLNSPEEAWEKYKPPRIASPQRKPLTEEEIQAALAEPVQEPFGYFRAEPFGWTDCAATDEGAIPLYTRPPAHQPLTVERLRDALVASRIVPPAAVEDPDGYDDGVTLHRIEALHRRLA